jgi:hypothetical protein
MAGEFNDMILQVSTFLATRLEDRVYEVRRAPLGREIGCSHFGAQ